MNNASERIKNLILLAAVIVGIAVFAAFTATEIAAVTYLFPLLAAVGALGLFTILIASVLACGCRKFRNVFCGAGLLAAFGSGGTLLAALITALIGAANATAFRIGTAITFALLTLLIGGVIGLVADYLGCVKDRSDYSCCCDSDCCCGDN